MRYLLFDMYGVLMQHAPTTQMAALIARTGAGKQGVSDAEFLRAWTDLRGPIDAGLINPGQFWARMQNRLGVALDGPAYNYAEPQLAGTIDSQMMAFALAQKDANTRVGVLSNIPHYMVQNLYARMAVLDEFDLRLYSCDLGAAKPQPEIYREAIARCGVPAEQILFFDDLEVNVAAARAAGLQAYVHQNLTQTAQRVRAFKSGALTF